MPNKEQQVSLADLVIDDLSTQVAEAVKGLAVAKARIKQLEQFIASNADVLGLKTMEDGSMVAMLPDSPPDAPPPAPAGGRPRRAPNNGKAAPAKSEA